MRIWGPKRLAQKLRRIILLLFGLVTFRFHFGKTRKLMIFMVFGFWDVTMTPKTNIICLRRHQDTPINSIKILEIFFKKIIYGNVKSLEMGHFENFGRDRGVPTVRLTFFENLEYEINIFQKA